MENTTAEPIIIYTEQVPRASSTLADTRVMSPNIQSNAFGVQWWRCPLCQQQARGEPAVCSHCGKWGHNVCVAIEQFQGWPVCGGCVHDCCLEYSQITALGAANRQLQWNDKLNVQLTNWKSVAVEAMGQSASIGVSMGSAAATVAGAVVAGFQGFAKGALQAASAQVAIPDQQPALLPQRPVPLPPPEEPPLPLRKVRSTQDLFITTIDKPHPPCPVCDQGKKGKHTYMGTCKGMPWTVWQQQKRSQPQVENPTSGQAASSAEPLPINTTTMTEDLTHLLDQDDGINIQIPPTSHSLGQTFGSAKSVTLYPEFVVSSTYLPPPQEMPQPRVVAPPQMI